ncbi:MAG: hypothetical protein Q8R63_10335 [Ramlibacter sp.]|nr:hypothetical protein [Ramlibacter sp.]
MKTKHVCLVTPGHLSTNPRLVKEADALVGAGYQVTVIASRFIEWADAADSEFDSRPWAVHKVAFGRLAGRRTHAMQKLGQLVASSTYRSTGLCADRAFHPVVPALIRAACAVQADLYIAHNLAALPAAAAAAKMYGAKLGFDAEDFHRGEFHSEETHDLSLQLTGLLENRYIPGCEHLTAASPGIAEAYEKACGVNQPAVILNVFPKTEAPPNFTPRGTADADRTVYWFSQSIGPDRGLETAVRAIAATRTRPLLVLRGAPRPGYRNFLVTLAQQFGVADRLRFLEPIAPHEMLTQASLYDLGLASEVASTVNRDICLTNKIFTYVQAGLPVLASATRAQSQLARNLEGAMFVYPPTEEECLAGHIDALLTSPELLARARQTSFELGQTRFNWQVEQQAYLNLIASCLDQKRCAH